MIARMRGPFLGVSCKPHRQAGDVVRSPLAINVDSSDGTIRSRLGYSVIVEEADGYRIIGITGITGPGGEGRVLEVVLRSSDVVLKELTTSGNLIETHDLHGWPTDRWQKANFCQYGSKVFFSQEGGPIYQYEWGNRKGSVEQAAVSRNEAVVDVPYLEAIPFVNCMIEHDGRMLWGGVNPDSWTTHDYKFPASFDLIPSEYRPLGEEAKAVRYPSQTVLISDANYPTGVMAQSFVGLHFGSEVRAMCSTPEGAFMFSHNCIYKLIPYGDFKYSPQTMLKGVGCVNQRSVAYGMGTMCWVDSAGIYAYDSSGMRKISDDIEHIFRREGWRELPMMGYQSYSRFASRGGWPFRVVTNLRRRDANATFYQEKQQFWFSLPVAAVHADNDRLMMVVFVWTPETGAWDVYAPIGSSSMFSYFSPQSMANVFDGTRWRLFFSNDVGQICEYGADAYDKDDTRGALNDVTVRWMWQSPWIEPNPDSWVAVRKVEIVHKALGSYSTTDETPKFRVESERTFDEEDDGFDTPLFFEGSVFGSPKLGPPNNGAMDHYWGEGQWDNFDWHAGDFWRARYNTETISGNAFRVGFTKEEMDDCGDFEIREFALVLSDKNRQIP